jgi:hypothetical protein
METIDLILKKEKKFIELVSFFISMDIPLVEHNQFDLKERKQTHFLLFIFIEMNIPYYEQNRFDLKKKENKFI